MKNLAEATIILPRQHVKPALTKFGRVVVLKPSRFSSTSPQVWHTTLPQMVWKWVKTCELCRHSAIYGLGRLAGVGFYPDGKRPIAMTPIFIRTLVPGVRPNPRRFYPDRLKAVRQFGAVFIRTLQRHLGGMSGVLLHCTTLPRAIIFRSAYLDANFAIWPLIMAPNFLR